MRQWLRYCSLTVEGVSGAIDLSELRTRFSIRPLPFLAPAIGEIKVTNLGAEKAKAIAKAQYKTITIDAGYQDGHGIIFKGDIRQAIYGRESPTDTLLTIIAADGHHGDAYATVNTTHPAGSTQQDHLNTALDALGKYGITRGYIGVDLSKPVYPRAVTLWGMARDVLARIAKANDAMVFYDRKEVTMLPRRGAGRPGGAIVLNSTTGLIGMPTQTTDAIFARCLINPQIRRGSIVQIDQKDIQGTVAQLNNLGEIDPGFQPAEIAADGIYVVVKFDIVGDTRGNEWYMDLALWARSQPGGPLHSAYRTYALNLGAS